MDSSSVVFGGAFAAASCRCWLLTCWTHRNKFVSDDHHAVHAHCRVVVNVPLLWLPLLFVGLQKFCVVQWTGMQKNEQRSVILSEFCVAEIKLDRLPILLPSSTWQSKWCAHMISAAGICCHGCVICLRLVLVSQSNAVEQRCWSSHCRCQIKLFQAIEFCEKQDCRVDQLVGWSLPRSPSLCPLAHKWNLFKQVLTHLNKI